MLYHILIPLVHLALKVFFKKIYLTNTQRIKGESPIIFAVNHPTAFLEPMVLACNLPMPMHFMIRGDRFEKPLFKWLLNQIKAVPIFRLRDGFSKVRQGESFHICYDLLASNGNLIILSEGKTKYEKRLRTIQRGTARIAFGALERNPELDLKIIPVGVNFTDSHRFRSEIMIDFGEPIAVQDYFSSYQQEERKTVVRLTKDIESAMRKRIVHVEDPKDDDLANQLLEIQRNNLMRNKFPVVEKENSPLEQEINLVNRLNALPEFNLMTLRSKAEKYQQLLSQYSISDKALSTSSIKNKFWVVVISTIYLPFFYLINCPPLFLAKWFADKNIKQIEFHAPVRFSVGLGFYLLYMILLLVIGSVFIGLVPTIVFLFVMVAMGFVSLHTLDLVKEWLEEKRFNSVEKASKAKLVEARKELGEVVLSN